MATCREATRELQSYLDGETNEITAERLHLHLEACRRCGLEASVYREIKKALARRAPLVDRATVERLRAFGAALGQSAGPDAQETDPPA
jgi:anti-sigma factor RsiW